MPRSARITSSHGFYHVYNRGINKESIFRDERDYARLLSSIRIINEHQEWNIYAYCLMPNHYHFLIEEKRIPLSKLLGRMFTGYSLYFNKKYNGCGSLFQDRFKSKIIQKDTYFLEVSRYIHVNPVQAGFVKLPEEYPYSSMREYYGRIVDPIVSIEKVQRVIGENHQSIKTYQEFVYAGIHKNLEEYNPFLSQTEVFGGRTFSSHKKVRRFA